MRSGLVIAIVAAVIIVLGAAFWYNNQTGTGLIEQRPDDILEPGANAPDTLDEDVGAVDPVVIAPEIEGESPVSDPAPAVEEVVQPIAIPEREDVAEDQPEVVGDPITEDTIVVDSATDDAVVLEPSDAPTVEFADETTATDGSPVAERASVDAPGTDEAPEGTDAPATNGDAGTLLTPEAFDAQQVRALIEESTTLSDTERSALTALVDGAGANPDMVAPAIAAIREALGLSPLE